MKFLLQYLTEKKCHKFGFRMYNIKMEKDKVLKIIIIAGFCTIILTPLSLAIMWFFTDWKKKTKIIFSAVAAGLYAATIAIVLVVLLSPKV